MKQISCDKLRSLWIQRCEDHLAKYMDEYLTKRKNGVFFSPHSNVSQRIRGGRDYLAKLHAHVEGEFDSVIVEDGIKWSKIKEMVEYIYGLV